MALTMTTKYEVKKIVLRDLESILRQSFGKQVIVQNYSTNSLLPPGENYGSTILSVRAMIKKTENSEPEDIRLIAKMSPPTTFQKWVFDSPFTFRKEIFMYENILPAYNQLERQAGLMEHEIFNILPKFYGSRLSMDSNTDFDDNAAILLENLKVKGYYTGNRKTGYDLEHSMVAIQGMARFHALGIAMKYKNPELFEVFKKQSQCMNLDGQNFDDIHTLILKKIEEDVITNPYYEKCRKLLTNIDPVAAWTAIPDEPWSTIIHTDFWVNNIMFHRDDEGKVDDVKFIDFQNYLFFSPLRQLIFYLFSSVNEDVHENHLEELINFYHECFIDVLIRMGCDTRPFLKEKFDAQLPEDANFEFVHLCFMLRVLTIDATETKLNYNKIANIMVDYEGSELFVEKMRRVILYFSKRNWI